MVQRALDPHGEPAQAASPEENLPRQFGKYTLLRKLAAGGMAELFLALHRSVAGFEKLIVIKRILPSMNQDQAFIDMLMHEARIAATLNAPEHRAGVRRRAGEGMYFIAMEHIHGEDIRSIVRGDEEAPDDRVPPRARDRDHHRRVRGPRLRPRQARPRRRHAHIVHRDISPQNVVVTFTGDVKIVDFGIAKSGSQNVGEDTKDGQLKGKVPYMSPEQASGSHVDWRSDIFATGVLLFELTTGKRLFKGASEYETLKLICEREYPLPSLVKPGYPPDLERVVMKALTKNRDERYQSAREMQHDLEEFVRNHRIAVSALSISRWMQSMFEDKLAAQKEALQDVKQLADIIASQASQQSDRLSMLDGSLLTTSTGLAAAGTLSGITEAPKKRGIGLWLGLGVLLIAGAAGGLYVRKVTTEAEARTKAAQDAAAAAEAAAAAMPQEAPKLRGALEIATTPPGCAIWVNGDLRAETTPAKVENLPLDTDLSIKLTKEGLEAYRETARLTEAAPTKTISTEMKTGSVTVVLNVDPPATVWVDGKPWVGERTKITGLSAGEEHRIVLSAQGYVAKTVAITAQQGETKTVDEKLVKGDASQAAPASTGDKPAAPVAASGGSGTIRIGAKGGYCNVSVNGTPYGPTPTEATVAAGPARVTCKPASGPSMTQGVTVVAGQIARVSFKIE
jgi:serine/threonine protein kinase